jgi:hypothetical protein
MKRLVSTLVILIVLINYLSAQMNFSKHKLLDDIDSLYVTINDIHPDMFAFLSQHEFEHKMNEAKSLIEDSMTISEFFYVIAPLIAKLGDGHTSVYYPYNILENETKMFPLKIDIKYPCMSAYVTYNLSGSNNYIPEGALIKKINGIEMKELAANMLSIISGEQEFFKVAMLNQRIVELMYIVLPDTAFKIEYIFHNQKHTKDLRSLDYSEIKKAIQQREETQKKEADYSLHIDYDNKIAIIYFNELNDLSSFKIFIDSAFTEIRNDGISDLIIDIRKNNGGDSHVGDYFFQYISEVPYQQFGKVQVKLSERQIAFQKKHFGFDYGDMPLGVTTIEVDDLWELRENDLRFSGNIYLLTSHYTFSSASSFAWAFQYFNMGTVVGEETGGLVVSFGDIIPQILPNTQMQFGASFKKFYLYGATDENTHGVIPDYEVSQENAMDFAVGLIFKTR